MAIILKANYSKKLGLPDYSSHSYMLTLETEISDLSQITSESIKLHTQLQAAVDRELQQVGFVPPHGYGLQPGKQSSGNNSTRPQTNGAPANGTNGSGNGKTPKGRDEWLCSDKQRSFIEKIVEENNIPKGEVESLALQMFEVGVKELNKLEASGLIDELLERYNVEIKKPAQRRGREYQQGSKR